MNTKLSLHIYIIDGDFIFYGFVALLFTVLFSSSVVQPTIVSEHLSQFNLIFFISERRERKTVVRLCLVASCWHCAVYSISLCPTYSRENLLKLTNKTFQWVCVFFFDTIQRNWKDKGLKRKIISIHCCFFSSQWLGFV